MIRRILVPVDPSTSSQSALSIAASIAGIIKAELWGLYVTDLERFTRFSLPMAIAESLVGESIQKAPLPPDELLAEIESADDDAAFAARSFQQACNNARVQGHFFAENGTPAEVILDFGRAVDLVVMGARGHHTGANATERGSTVHTLLESSTRPVLVVPEEATGASTIVVAYDESPASERVLRTAAEMADITDMYELHLITVSDDLAEGERIQSRAIQYLNAYQLDVTAKVLQGVTHQVISSYCKSVDASVVALGAHGGRGIIERIFGSTSTHLLSETKECAVLLMN